MTVNYDEAMQTLTSMFASVDREIIDAVLRANEWHMERTIDNLLSISDSAGTPSLAPPIPALSDPVTVAPTVTPRQIDQDELLARALQNDDKSIPTNPKQVDQDEMLARALQNELFLEEVRANPEFAAQSNLESDLSMKEVKEKFNQLGEAAKSKLRELSTIFFKREDKYDPVVTDALLASPTLAHSTSLAYEEDCADEEEIVAFDARVARSRRAQVVLSEDEEEEGLEDRRPHRMGHVGPVGPSQ